MSIKVLTQINSETDLAIDIASLGIMVVVWKMIFACCDLIGSYQLRVFSAYYALSFSSKFGI